MNHFEIYLDQNQNEWLCIPYTLSDQDKSSCIVFENYTFKNLTNKTGDYRDICKHVAVNRNWKWENFTDKLTNGMVLSDVVYFTATGKKVKNLSEFLATTENSQKYFIVHKESRTLYCAQNGRIVKYANEYDKRPFVVSNIVYTPDAFQKIDIDYKTYLILTGLKEKNKETELAEIKAKIISENTLGCQFEVLKPIVEDLLSLVHKVDGLKNYKKEATGVVIKTFTNIADDNTFSATEFARYEAVNQMFKDYVKKLKEN